MVIIENEKSLKQAEEKAKKAGLYTLIWVSKCGPVCGRNMVEMLKDGELKSLELLVNEGKIVKTVRSKLMEPEESNTYIDFCAPESLSSELVVASRQYEDIFSMDNIKYNPRVRMYFNLDGLIANENKVVDGLHTLRIRNRLSLEALKYIVFSNIEDLDKVQSAVKSDIQNKVLVLNINDKVGLEYFVTSANNIVEDREKNIVRR